MPTVPSNFVPQIAPQDGGRQVPYEAPGVQPIENYAAKQQIEIGQRTVEAGTVMFRAGGVLQDAAQKAILKREDELNETTAKELDTFALQRMTEIAAGQNGYLRTTGKDAETSFAAANDALSNVTQEVLGRTTNDVQRKMLMPALSRNMLSFQTRMLDHRDQQVKTYYTNESIARAEQYADSAVRSFVDIDSVDARTGQKRGAVGFEADVHTALDEINKAADAMGLPSDSAQRTAMEQKVRDKITSGVIAELVQRKQYGRADDFLTAQEQDGKIDPQVQERLRNNIDGNRQRTTVDELTDSILQNGALRSESDPNAYKDDIDADATPPAALRDALDIADRIKDSDMRRMVKNNVKSEWASREALVRGEYEAKLDRVDQFLADPRNTIWDMPADWFGALKPTDREKYMTGQRRQDELGAMEELARNPAKLTKEWLEENRSRFTPATYTKFLADLNKPEKIADAAYDAEMVNAALAASKQFTLLKPNPKDETEVAAAATFRYYIKQRIDTMQQRMKRTLNDAEKREIIDQAIMDQGGKQTWLGGTFGHGTLKPIASMSPEEWLDAMRVVNDKEIPVVPPAMRAGLEAQLKAKGWEVTPYNMYRLWTNLGNPR